MAIQEERVAGRGWAWGAAIILSLTACGGADERTGSIEEPSAPPAESARAALPAPPPRPATRHDTLWVEGLAQPVTLRRFDAPAGFALPFSTYLPPDMSALSAAQGSESRVRFVAELGGTRNDSAYVSVVVPEEGLSVDEAGVRARELAERYGRAQRRSGEQGFPWAREWYGFDSPSGVVGSVLVGAHDGRPFLVVVRYPAEMGDGMQSRLQAILDQWRWANGEGLSER